MKPRIFLGSSAQQEKLVAALTRGLADIAEVDAWTAVFNPGVTQIVKLPNRGHALTIDHGWQEVAQTALDFVKRFASPGYQPGRSVGTAPADR